MATVRMVKGNRAADIYDSPETIAQAQKDGYVFVENRTEKKAEKKEEVGFEFGEEKAKKSYK